MCGSDENDPYGIISDGFCEAYGADTIPEALETARRVAGTTPDEEKERCPNCASVRLRAKPGTSNMPHKRNTNMKCTGWRPHFDEPCPPLAECPVEHA